MADAQERTLAGGDWRCTVSPFGASLRRLWLTQPSKPERDVLWGYTGAANKQGGQGDVLAPWPNRIRDGKYTFAGRTFTLPLNDKQGPNAIHGFLRSRTWDVDHDESVARFRTRIHPDDHPGYPFDIEVGVAYALDARGLTCAFVARNCGDAPAPFAVGFHPYVAGAADDVLLHLPAANRMELADLLPTGRLLEVHGETDFRVPRRIGRAQLNDCYTGLRADADGFVRIRANDVILWMDPAFTHVVVYTGDALGPAARKAVAIEPMTCGVDALSSSVAVLEPGAVAAGTWGLGLATPGAAAASSR